MYLYAMAFHYSFRSELTDAASEGVLHFIEAASINLDRREYFIFKYVKMAMLYGYTVPYEMLFPCIPKGGI